MQSTFYVSNPVSPKRKRVLTKPLEFFVTKELVLALVGFGVVLSLSSFIGLLPLSIILAAFVIYFQTENYKL